MIDGVIITPLKRISHPKGDILHAMKSSENSFSSFGEAYFSNVQFKEIKGWKKHTEMILNLIVPVGEIKFVIYDDRQESSSYQSFYEVIITPDNYCRLTIPNNLWVAFQGVGCEQNLLLNISSIEHNPEESINCEIDNIKYQW